MTNQRCISKSVYNLSRMIAIKDWPRISYPGYKEYLSVILVLGFDPKVTY